MPDSNPETSRGSGASVVILADRVIKRQDPIVARSEYERTEWGSRVGDQSTLFRVPRIYSYDDVKGELVFERITNAEPLNKNNLVGPLADSLMARLGRALAVIHSVERPVSDRADSDLVSLHGDFGCGNIYYSPAQDRLWVLDWSPGNWIGLPFDVRLGSSSLDLTTFLLSLFYRRSMASDAIPYPERLARIFLEEYLAERNGEFKLTSLRAQLPAIARRWEATRGPLVGWGRVVLYHRSVRQLRRFVRRLELTTVRLPA